jgi:predicted glycosyltransferase
MTYVFDIGHPAHVHYFKALIKTLKSRGHQVIVFARDKECTLALLDAYGIDYVNRGKGSSSLLGKFFYILKTDATLFFKLLFRKKDVFIGFASPYAAHVAWVFRKRSITIDDTDKATLSHKLYLPFTSQVLTPVFFEKDLGKKHERFNSFMELSYLHPDVFKPSQTTISGNAGATSEPYAIVRFVSWGANHDVGQFGMNREQKLAIVEELSKHMRVFISSESELPQDLSHLKLNIAPHELHDVLSGASLYIGEGATMAAEAAMLGIPAIYTNTLTAGTLHAMRDRGLLHIWNPKTENLMEVLLRFVTNPLVKSEAAKRREALLLECDNPTEFFLNFIDSPHQNR